MTVDKLAQHINIGHLDALKKSAFEAEALLQQSLSDDTLAWTTTMTLYGERWQQITADAYSFQLNGLGKSCALFSALPLTSDAIKKNDYALLQEWHTLFIAYLNAPELEQTRTKLTHYLYHSHWNNVSHNEGDIDALINALHPKNPEREITMDFNLDLKIEQPISANTITEDAETELDLGMDFDLDLEIEQPLSANTITEDTETELDLGMDFDLDLEIEQPISANTITEDAEAELDLGMDFDLDLEIEQPISTNTNTEGTELDLGMDFDLDLNPSNDSDFKTLSPDLLVLIQTEFEPYAESMLVTLEPEIITNTTPEQFNQAMNEQEEELEILARVTETVGLDGLHQIFVCLHSNMQALFSGKKILTNTHSHLLKTALSDILHYLAAIDNEATHTALIQNFQNTQWPTSFSQADAIKLTALFKTIKLLSPEEARGPRKVASIEEIDITIPEDVNQDLLDSLHNELPILTADFTAAVQQLISHGQIADVEKAQRIAHTLKGSGNLVGITGIASLTHNIEEILEKIALHGHLPKGIFDSLFMDCADCLESMSESALSQGSPPDNALFLLQQLLDCAYQISADGIPDSSDTATKTINTVPAIPVQAEATTAQVPTKKSSSSAPETMTRVSTHLVDDMLRMAGENNILTGQIQQRLDDTIDENQTLHTQHTGLLTLITEFETLVEEQGTQTQRHNATLNDDFDPLEMDQYNELHTYSNRLLEITTDAQEAAKSLNQQLTDLKGLLEVQERLQKENHELVLRTRMVPVQTVVPRFERAVRQASRLTGKSVKLQVIGKQTLIDREILDSLIDSLMHLLRNAVDHGIESPEQRVTTKKNKEGHITLEFSRRGNQILVICQDDGGGLDLPKIRALAEQKEIVAPDQVLSERELQRLVLTPGFSTKDSATQVSGRGIGMDAVHVQILKMKGELDIISNVGKGCRIELSLPASLASIHAILIQTGSQTTAISNYGLEQILYPGAGTLKESEGTLTYHQGDQTYPAQRLETLLNISLSETAPTDSDFPILLFKTDQGETKAVLVEQVIDSRELLVKNMGQYIPEIPGIAGTTILGDGHVTAVLDIPDLLRISQGQTLTGQSGQMSSEFNTSLPKALVVDDSLSARRSLAQLMKDMGYLVETAIDGIDAIDKIDETQPDIILVDLEMPRMNGMELTTYLRDREDTEMIPVIMITSRATEKHRQQAITSGVNEYLTKPFSEDEMMIQVNKLTNIASMR